MNLRIRLKFRKALETWHFRISSLQFPNWPCCECGKHSFTHAIGYSVEADDHYVLLCWNCYNRLIRGTPRDPVMSEIRCIDCKIVLSSCGYVKEQFFFYESVDRPNTVFFVCKDCLIQREYDEP